MGSSSTSDHLFLINAGIVPFDDLSMLGFESVSLLDDFGSGVSPTFTIVDSKKYIREINSENSSVARTSTLPPSFLVSLSYKPKNNTVLRLLSSHLKTVVQSQTPPPPIAQNSPIFNTPESDSKFLSPFQNDEVDNGDGSASMLDESLESEFGSGIGNSSSLEDRERQDNSLASLLLSSTATYLQADSFLDLWTNITGSEQHNIVFMVVNGTVSSCLDGEFKLGEPEVGLWNITSTFKESEDDIEEAIQVKFSDALHAVQSVVSPRSHSHNVESGVTLLQVFAESLQQTQEH